jgi:hypothetical protein
MASRRYRRLKIIAFNVNNIWRQRYEINKQLQDSHIDVALFSETHLKPNQLLEHRAIVNQMLLAKQFPTVTDILVAVVMILPTIFSNTFTFTRILYMIPFCLRI